MKAKRLTMIATLVAVAVLFGGCKKEKQTEKTQNATSQMLSFDSFDEVIKYLTTEGTNKTNKNDFVSYAEYMEKEYLDLDPENYFKTKEEMIQFAMDHSDKYQLILGDDGEYTFETRMFNHDFKYVANKDGIFQIKDEVYRIVEGGLVYTSESHIQDLLEYVDKGYRESDGIFSYVVFSENELNNEKSWSCSNSNNWTKYNGDNKLYFEVKVTTTNSSTSPIVYKHYAKPYHHNFLGWFGCLRTITCSYDNQVVFMDNNGFWPISGENHYIPQLHYRWDFSRKNYVTTNQFESVVYLYHGKASWMWEYEHPNTGGFMFNMIDANASTLDVGNIRIYCPRQIIFEN